MTIDREDAEVVPFDAEPDPAGPASSGARLPGLLLATASVLPAVVAAAWLLAALPLVALHVYRPLPAIVFGLVLALLLGRPALRVARARARAWGAVPWWVLVGVVAVVVGFGVLAFVTSAGDVLVRRDPGSYSVSATWLAAHGTIVMPTHLAAFGGPDPNLVPVSQGFYLQGSHIVPQFMTGVPVLMAIGGWINGVDGVLHMNAFIGMLGLLTFAGLVARLVGPRWAPLAVLVLAFVQPELDVLRATYSEPAAQLILLGGLVLLLDALLVGKIRVIAAPALSRLGPDDRSDGEARDIRDCHRALLVSGFVLGVVLVVRIDAVADLLPIVLFTGWLAFHRLPAWRWLLAGLVVGLLVGVFDCVFLTLPYIKYVRGSLVQAVGGFVIAIVATIVVVRAGWASRRARPHRTRRWPEVALVAGLAVAAVVGATLPTAKVEWHVLAALGIAGSTAFGWIVARGVWWAQSRPGYARPRRLPTIAAAGVFIGGLFYFLRPHLMTMRSGATSGGAYYVAQVQRINGLPNDPTRSYYEDATRWLSWYFGWTALALALAAACWLAYELVAGRRREWVPVLATFLGMSAAVLAIPSITPDHPWADRRFVPVVLPAVAALAVMAVAQVFARVGERHWQLGSVRAVRSVIVAAAIAVLVVPAWWGSRGVFTAQTEKGEVALVRKVCAQLRPNDAVVAYGAAAESVWPGTVRVMCGVGVGYLDGRDNTAALARIGERVQAQGGRLMVLVDGTVTGDRAAVPGVVDWPQNPVAVLDTTELGHTLVKRPDHVAGGLQFEVWLGQLQVGG